jgi:hypothetical protein
MKKIALSLIFLLLDGCSSSTQTRTEQVLEKESLSSKQENVKQEEQNCITSQNCSFIERYVNGLGQECRIFMNSSNEKVIYCKSSEGLWESIEIL